MSPAAAGKADARRRQILEAARRCVLQAGFHGSSMQQIAQASSLSVGQIYRYFENKEAMIAALAAQDIADLRERFAAIEAAEGPLVKSTLVQCVEAIDRSIQADRAAVLLEVVAEAARNPKIAAVVQAADADERALRFNMLRRVCPAEVSDAEIGARAEILAAIFDGLAVRAIMRPMDEPGRPDRGALLKALKPVIEALLGEPNPAVKPPPSSL
jgi:AcrR family transcriptional regulator